MTLSLRLLHAGFGSAVLFFSATVLCHGAADTKLTSPISPATPTAAASSATTVAPAGVPFESFRPISDRNIFDPNRFPHNPRAAREPARPTGDTIALVGTMRYEKGYFAFFDSPDSKYRKVVHEGEAIAEFSVSQVSAGGVELVRNGKTLSLQVAQKLSRPLGEDWSVSAADPARAETMPASVTATTAPSAVTAPTDTTSITEEAATPPTPADASDTLKRLMEQRRKQLKE